MTLRIYLLGQPELLRDDAPVELRGRKPLALLTYLLLTGQPQSRQQLVDLLYDRSADPRASLRWTLHHLRRAVGAEYLSADRQRIGFNFETEYWLDVSSLEAGNTECYRGELLEGVHLPDAQSFMEWLLFERERVKDVYQVALAEVLARCEHRGDHQAVLDAAQRLLQMDNLRESWHRALMQAYARLGKREAALRHYYYFRELLYDELGVEPAPELRALYEKIQSGEPGIVTMASVPRPARPAVPHNLPQQATSFVGREAEIATVVERLRQTECRLLTLVGLGGIGKTRLAIAAAECQIADSPDDNPFPDGIFFVPLAGLRSADSLVPTIADAVQFSFYGGGRAHEPPQSQLLGYLSNKQMLLILDNFEHLLDGVSLVTDLLHAAPDMKIIVTSRQRLLLREEWAVEVGGLPIPAQQEGLDPASLGLSPAVQLFRQRAQQVDGPFRVDAGNAAAVVTICQLVEGMPLGIELAASWVHVVPCREIAAEIARSMDFLKSGVRNVPERHRSLRAVFEHSWRLLDDQEKDAMRCLSVFRGGFHREAAEAVAGAPLSVLSALLDKSLLRRTGRRGRYDMHELLRQFAAEKLSSDRSRKEEVDGRHSAYFCDFLQQHEADLQGSRLQSALARLDADGENVQAAWHWAVAHRESARLGRALDGLCHFYLWRRRFHDGAAACQAAALTLQGTAERRLLARILTWQSTFQHRLGQVAAAGELLDQGLSQLEMTGSKEEDARSERAAIYLLQGEISYDSDREMAQQSYQRSLDLCRATGNVPGVARALGALGRVALAAGNSRQAREMCEESLALSRDAGITTAIPRLLETLGNIALSEGRLPEAEASIRESITVRREIGDESSVPYGLNALGWTVYSLGRYSEACALGEECLLSYSEIGSRYSVVSASLLRGAALLHQGRYEEVEAQAREALPLSRAVKKPWGRGYAYFLLGGAALARENSSAARQWLEESVASFEEIGQQDELGQALALLACALANRGSQQAAWRHLQRALQAALQTHAFLPLMWALPVSAVMLARQGEHERAVALYAVAKRQPFVSHSVWFDHVTGPRLEASTAALPQAIAEAARSRRAAKDLWATAGELLGEVRARSE